MGTLYLTDRISLRGGADQHLLQVVADSAAAGDEVTLAAGRIDREVALPGGVATRRCRALGQAVSTSRGLGALETLLAQAEVVHVQNVMNPLALRLAVETGRALVTLQDHRVFCPGPGRTLPGGRRCQEPMSDGACRRCLPDEAYRERLLALTEARREALRGARRLLVLSRYMAAELEAVGLPGAEVIPPWVEVNEAPARAGRAFLLGGRLVAHKAVTLALSAWRSAGSPEALRVAGAGTLEATLSGTTRLGWLPADELRRELRDARALLFPSAWQEPFGILGVEALAEATPVIVTATGGTSDWSEAGCLVVPPGDVEAMAEAIRRLAADPEQAMALGEAGREMVRRRFARGSIAPRLRAIYAEVARGSGRIDPETG